MPEENNKPFEVDLEPKLRLYMPAMFRVLDNGNLKKGQWRNLNKRFVEEYYKRKELYAANNNYLRMESNFFDLIDATLRGEEEAFRLVGLFDILFKGLGSHLLVTEKIMVRDTIYSTLINFDHKCRNFIGELLVLLNAIENRRYSLIGVEIDFIAQNNTADFTLLYNSTGEKVLVEVVNIHLDNSDYLTETLNNKIKEKIEKKTGGNSDFKPFTLAPVIWAPFEVLKEIAALYKSGNGVEMDGVNEPLAYWFFSVPNGMPIYRFGKVSTLFPEGNIFVKWVD